MGHHLTAGEPVLPFVIRLYAYRGSDDIKLVHTVVIDSLSAERKISSLGIAFDVPMRERAYNRHIWLDRWTEPVQPLASRRMVRQGRTDAEALQVRQQRVTEPEQMDSQSRQLTDQLAQWDRFRLSQLSPKAFSIRKAATDRSPWIGTVEGTRADGSMFVGDVSGGLALSLRDFWQAFPSSLEVRNARSDNAEAILWLWSPEAEPMNRLTKQATTIRPTIRGTPVKPMAFRPLAPLMARMVPSLDTEKKLVKMEMKKHMKT